MGNVARKRVKQFQGGLVLFSVVPLTVKINEAVATAFFSYVHAISYAFNAAINNTALGYQQAVDSFLDVD